MYLQAVLTGQESKLCLKFGQGVFAPFVGPQGKKSKIRLRYALGVHIFYITAKFHVHPSTDKDEESI